MPRILGTWARWLRLKCRTADIRSTPLPPRLAPLWFRPLVRSLGPVRVQGLAWVLGLLAFRREKEAKGSVEQAPHGAEGEPQALPGPVVSPSSLVSRTLHRLEIPPRSLPELIAQESSWRALLLL